MERHKIIDDLLLLFPSNITSDNKCDVPCSKGEKVPASILMYGSIFNDVTAMPHELRIVPKDEAMTPLPTPEITPPVTRIYFIFLDSFTALVDDKFLIEFRKKLKLL